MFTILTATGNLGPIPPSDLGFDPFSVAAWIGILAPFIVALAVQFNWTKQQKFWTSVGVVVVLSVFAWWTTSYPAVWELIATQFAIIFAESQAIFWALKPTGILDWLEDLSSFSYQPKHAVEK